MIGNSLRLLVIRLLALRLLAIQLLAIATCVVLSGWTGSDLARAQELKISHQFKADVDARDRAARMLVAETLKRAPHLKLSVHPDSSLKIKPVEQLDAMAAGSLAMSVYPMIYGASKAPELAITMFPFIPADLDMALQLKGTPFHQKLQSLAEANGVHILTWWWLAGGIASRQGEIGGPETVKGLRMRVPDPYLERMFRDAGAVIAPPMTSPQLRDAMREGKMDGLITTLESLVGFRIYEHAKSATIGGLGNFVNFQPLLISKAVWDGLTVDEKYALESAAEATEGYFYSVQREAERNAIEAFTNAGARMHRVGLDEYESWIRMSKDSAWPAYRALSPVADELFVALLTSLIQSGKGDPAAGGSRGN